MNWSLIFFLLLSAGGLFFVFKKMKVGKSDWEKLKNKFKKKKSPEQQAWENGEIIIPLDKRDYEDISNFKEGIKDNKILSEQLKNIDKEFKEWTPIKEETKVSK